jgi:hypothetical protein
LIQRFLPRGKLKWKKQENFQYFEICSREKKSTYKFFFPNQKIEQKFDFYQTPNFFAPFSAVRVG